MYILLASQCVESNVRDNQLGCQGLFYLSSERRRKTEVCNLRLSPSLIGVIHYNVTDSLFTALEILNINRDTMVFCNLVDWSSFTTQLLKPQSHRIVRLLDRTIGCDLANVRPIGNVCYDLQKPQQRLEKIDGMIHRRKSYD